MIKLAIRILLFLIFAFLATNFFFCKKNAYQVIHIDINHLSNRLKIKIDTIICLETKDASLIGEVLKIKHYNEHFYVLDRLISRNVFLFSKDGSYISSLPRGKGPGEVIAPVELLVDKKNETILVWDQGNRKLMKYDLSLNFIDFQCFENLYISTAEFIDINRILINSPVLEFQDQKQNYLLYSIFNLETNKYETKFYFLKKELIGSGLINPISVTSERVLFSAPFDNSLYALEDNGYRKIMHFNFGEMGITADDIRKGTSYVFSETWAGRKIVPFYSISESEKYMALNFGLNGMDNFFIYSKSTGESYFSFNLVNEGLLPNCRMSGLIGEGQYLAFSSPVDIIEFAKINDMAAKAKTEIDEGSNPCLVVFSVHEDE